MHNNDQDHTIDRENIKLPFLIIVYNVPIPLVLYVTVQLKSPIKPPTQVTYDNT